MKVPHHRQEFFDFLIQMPKVHFFNSGVGGIWGGGAPKLMKGSYRFSLSEGDQNLKILYFFQPFSVLFKKKMEGGGIGGKGPFSSTGTFQFSFY